MPYPRASISQDYWGDKRSLRVPQKQKLFVKLHIIFALKYNKQQLLLLLDKINDITSKMLGDITMDIPHFINIGGTCPQSKRFDAPGRTRLTLD